MGLDQLKELKRLQKENERLRRAVSDLTLDKLILKETARENFRALLVEELASITFEATSNFLNFELVEFWGNIDPHKDTYLMDLLMKPDWLLI